MSKVAIVFPTYKRPKKSASLVRHIREQDTQHEYEIYSFVDGDDYNVDGTICESTDHHGKEQYWRLYNRIIEKVKGKYDYYIYLADDLTIAEKFIDEAVEKLKNCDGIVLSLLTDKRIENPNWTNFKPIVKGEYIQTQWVDMAMIFNDRFVKIVGKCQGIDPMRWKRNPNLSTGVGQWISRTLHSKGEKAYHLKDSLLFHGVHKSVMYEKHRVKTPIKNMLIIAGMATFKGRERCILDAFNSIINQVDELHIYVNDDSVIDKKIENNPKVTLYRHPEGDLGDVGKFYLNQGRPAYYLAIDDDLIYPTDFVSKTIEGIEKYDRPVTGHGRNLNKRSNSYYKGKHELYKCLKTVERDVEVEFPGTCAFGWKKEMVKFNLDDFKEKNMADIFVGIKLINLGIKAVCLAHKQGWVRHSDKLDMKKTIYSDFKHKGEGNQMKYIKELCHDSND